MAANISGTGFKISNMDSAEKTGTMVAITKDFTIKQRNRDKENTNGQMEIAT